MHTYGFLTMLIFCRSQEIANSGGNYTLNLSTQSLSVKTCGILAKLLSTSNPFVDIKFNNCSLPDEGMDATIIIELVSH